MDKLLSYPGKSDKGVFTFLIDEEKGYLEKTASQYHPTIASYINAARPIPGVTQVLLTALGAGEYWGDNVNSDFFGEDQLAHEGDDYGYKTFQNLAKVYKHHCFVAGTLVKTKEGLLPIEDVGIGSEVYTGSGSLAKVTNIFKRRVSSSAVRIRISGSDEDIVCTDEHPFLVVKKASLKCPVHNNNPSGNFCTFYKHDDTECGICGTPRKAPKEEWLTAAEISAGDYLISVKSLFKKEGGEYEKALGTLAGFFLADGCYGKNKGVREEFQIVFWKERLGNHIKLADACKTLGVEINGPYEHKKSHTFNFVVKGGELVNKFYEWFGEYSHGKKLSFDCVDVLGREGCLSLVGAFIDGDGSVAKTNSRNAGQVRLRSCNKMLLSSVRSLLLDLGINSSVLTDCLDKEHNLDGYIIKSKASSVLLIPANASHMLADYSCKIKGISGDSSPSKSSTRSFSYDDKIYHFVSSTEHSEIIDTDVFNLEVEREHTYQVNCLVTHNCNKDPRASYGDVLLSVYNPGYHRVELVVGIRHKDAPDIIDRIESGDYPMWSMGCKIPYDVCNICGNRAPNRKFYCDHLRYMLGHIDPQSQRKVYAINIKPRFFDISYVLIPADKTALTLKKVAFAYNPGFLLDAQGRPIRSSAEAAEKAASIEKEIPAGPPASEEVLDIDKASDIIRAGIELREREKPIPTPVLDRIAGMGSLSDVMSTLSALMIMPKPQEFQRIYLVCCGQKHLADKLDGMGACFDPEVFTDPTQRHEEILGLSPHRVSIKIAREMEPFLGGRSNFGPLLVSRMEEAARGAPYQESHPLYYAPQMPREENHMDPVAILGLGAALYAAMAKGAVPAALKSLSVLATKHPILTTAVGLGLLSRLTDDDDMHETYKGRYTPNQEMYPDSSHVWDTINRMRERPYIKIGAELPQGRLAAAARRLLIGVPAVQVTSSYLQKRKEMSPQADEGRVSRFIRKHPNLLSAALAADAVLATQGKGTIAATRHVGDAYRSWLKGEPLHKAANVVMDVGPYPEVKAASVQDFATSSLVWPAVMGTANLPGRIVGGLIDQAALSLGSKLVEKNKQQKAITPSVPS